jgi:hypothetical protein
MKVTNDNLTLKDFNAWSGAVETKKTIIDNNKEKDFDFLIEELFPDGIEKTKLNDLLWFDDEFLFESLNIEI